MQLIEAPAMLMDIAATELVGDLANPLRSPVGDRSPWCLCHCDGRNPGFDEIAAVLPAPRCIGILRPSHLLLGAVAVRA
jgi:hypothetical protein